MKTQVALLLLGFAAFTAASGLRKLQEIPIKKTSYGAPAASIAYTEEGDKKEVAEEPAAVVYKAPVRNIEKAPIRVVSYDKEEAPARTHGKYDDAVAQEQNRNAHYNFASSVDDGIMDHSHIRQETREGSKVTGQYGYSDGFFKRTVTYEADENGYRVVSETVEPISEDGPQVDLLNGKAEVHTQISGVDTQYSVNAEEIALMKDNTAKKATAAAASRKEKEY